MSEPNLRLLAEQLQTRGPVPECFAGVLIGITEVERDLIVKALCGTPPEERSAWREIKDRDALGASLYCDFPIRITARMGGRYFQFIVPAPKEVTEPQNGKS